MQKNIRFEMVVTDNRQDPRPFPFAGQRAYNMEIYFIFRIVAVIICQSAHKAVEAVPVVHFRHSDQVQLFRSVILLLLHRNRLKINSVGDAYGVSAKYFFRIGESDDTVQSLCELVTETSVDGQMKFHGTGDVLLIVRISRNFHHHFCACTFQRLHQPEGERTGIVKRAHIYKVDSFVACIVKNRRVVDTFPNLCGKARAEISDHFVIHHPTPFAIRGHIIMTQANIHSTIFEGFHLITYLLTNSVGLIEAVKYKEKSFHSYFQYSIIVYSVFSFSNCFFFLKRFGR